MKKLWLVAAVLASATSAEARQSDAVSRIIGVVGSAMADAKIRRQIAAVSQPLVYESALPISIADDLTEPRNMTVAGLKLGLLLAQVRQTLQRAGFTVSEESKEFSFAMRVLPKINGSMPQDVRSLSARGRNGQHVQVRFASLPEGAVVDEVEFGISDDAMTKEAFLAQLGSRYGEADVVAGDELVWCTKVEGRCLDEQGWQGQPHLRADPSFRTIHLVFVDPARGEALEARVRAILEAQKPKVEQADF